MCTEYRIPLLQVFLPLLLLVSCGSEEEAVTPQPTVPPSTRESSTVKMAPVRFVEATSDFGLDFLHTSGADGRKFLPETMGSGACLFDRDGDGDLDLFLVNGRGWDEKAGPSVGRLYDLQDGHYRDMTAEAGLDDPAFSIIGQGVCAGDFDGDGDWDLYLTALGPNLLLENRGSAFVDVSAASGVAGGDWTDDEGREHPEWSTSATFCDFDGDGWLDLFVCNYLQWSIENNVDFVLSGDAKGYASPKLYPGSSCRLYRNKGNGSFEDVSALSGIQSPDHKAMGVCIADVDRDGRPDILVANDTQPNCLFLNRGRMRFEDIARDSGIGYGSDGGVRAGMGIDAAYYREDGELAVAVGNFSQEPISFFRTIGSGRTLFSDDNMVTGLGRSSGPRLTFSTVFLDANLDGHVDLLAINGHLEPDIELISASTSWRQRPQLFINRGGAGRFIDGSLESGPAFERAIVGRGLALGDLDGDGDLDVVVTECGGPARIWRNESSASPRSLRLKLRAPSPNVHAIGAEVRVCGGPFPQTAWVRTGSAYLSQHETTLTFGLGEASKAEVEIRWPDGLRSTHGPLEVGAEHLLRHPSMR